MYFWLPFQKNSNQTYSDNSQPLILPLTTSLLAKSSSVPKPVSTNFVSRSSFLKNYWKIKNHFGVPAKSPTCRSNAKRKRIVIAVLRRKGMFENSKLQTFHQDVADLESPTDFSERNHPLPENSNESTQVDALSARNKVILPETVQTSLPKLFVLSNIYNNLQCFLIKKMLNQISLNRHNKMIKWHSSL